jgi:hypothetical protein
LCRDGGGAVRGSAGGEQERGEQAQPTSRLTSTSRPASQPSKQAAPPREPAKKYELKSQPAVGQRVEFEDNIDSTLKFEAFGGGNRSVAQTTKTHLRLAATCDETLELSSDGGHVTARRITFALECGSETRVDNKPPQTVRLACSGRTVTLRIKPDGSIDQEFGVKQSPEQTKMLRRAIEGQTAIFPNHPVTVGERWRADDAFRAMLGLKETDTISAICTLKGVREQDGRSVADIAVSAGAISQDARGFGVELNFAGMCTVDAETGVTVRADLVGHGNVAATQAVAVNGKHANRSAATHFSGDTTFTLRRSARLLPPRSDIATAATDAAPAK